MVLSVPYSPFQWTGFCRCIHEKQSSRHCLAKPQPRSSHPRDIHKPQLKTYFGWGFTIWIASVQPGFPQSNQHQRVPTPQLHTVQVDCAPWGYVDNSTVFQGFPCSMGIFRHYNTDIHKHRRQLWRIMRQKYYLSWDNTGLSTAWATRGAQNWQGGNRMICITFIMFAIFPKLQPVDNVIR